MTPTLESAEDLEAWEFPAYNLHRASHSLDRLADYLRRISTGQPRKKATKRTYKRFANMLKQAKASTNAKAAA